MSPKIAYFIQIFAAEPNGQTEYFVIRFLQNKGLGIILCHKFLFQPPDYMLNGHTIRAL